MGTYQLLHGASYMQSEFSRPPTQIIGDTDRYRRIFVCSCGRHRKPKIPTMSITADFGAPKRYDATVRCVKLNSRWGAILPHLAILDRWNLPVISIYGSLAHRTAVSRLLVRLNVENATSPY